MKDTNRNMKGGEIVKNLLYAVVLLTLGGCQTVPPMPQEPVPAEYIRTFEFEKFKPELFTLSMRWIVQSFVSAKSLIQYSDKEEGIIVGNGRTAEYATFCITIEIKQGKVRMTFSGFDREPISNVDAWNRAMESRGPGFDLLDYEILLTHMTAMAESYQSYVSATSTDW